MITSLKNETIKELLKLKQKKYRDETNCFLIEGYHLVDEALKKGIVKTIITCREFEYQDVEVLKVNETVMEKLAFTKTPQPIMALCEMKIHQDVDYNQERYLLLDRLQDPGNVGTILRTASALGYKNVLISKDSVDLYNDKVIRATQGALFSLNISLVNLKNEIKLLQSKGVKVYATALRNARVIDEYSREEKMAFIMGNEGNGVSDEIIDISDGAIYIPIETMESLNVGIASAIVMYQFK